MDESLNTRLEGAGLERGLLEALRDLLEQFERLKPEMTYLFQRRLPYLLDSLVDEVIDPRGSILWWEMTLYLLEMEARRLDHNGQPLVRAVEALLPLLRQHLGQAGPVHLEAVTGDTFLGTCLLSETLQEPQSHMVAPNVYSLAQAHFNPNARFWAIHAGQTPVGFMMIVDDDQTPEYFLWRFMIGTPYQGRDYGRQAIERLVEYLRSRPGAVELTTSCSQGEGSPEGFYRRLGFEPTGEFYDDEMVLKLMLPREVR